MGYEAYSFLHTAPVKEGQSVYFDVAAGARLGAVAEKLQAQGIITNARYFTFLARFKNEQNKMKAGRFALRTDWFPEQVLATLVHGKPVLYRITVPEGLTYWQTGLLLEEAGFVKAADFNHVVCDPAFLRHHGIPFPSAEGFLMPDTYLLKKPETNLERGLDDTTRSEGTVKTQESSSLLQAKAIAGRLVDTFWQKTQELWPNSHRPPKDMLQRSVILASIVEKETALEEERPRVAGVYANRLEKKMLLQADPTVIYGLGPSFSGRLLYRHLNDTSNKYNTYQHPGLPPGPICSFGISALKAALHPEQHDFLYFVAKTDGGEHVFSRRLEEHNRAVQEYRKTTKKNK